MQQAVRLMVCGLVALAVRAAAGQGYGPSPGERGDPYRPLGPPAQVQERYPLPPPGQQPRQPAPSQPAQRYPLPQQPAPPLPPPAGQPQPQPQQASYAPRESAIGGPSATPPPIGELFQPTQTIAIVGNEHIFYGDVSPTVDQILAPIIPQIRTDSDRQELEKVRQNLTRQFVRQIIDTKLMYLEFERQIEKNAGADKLVEVRKTIASKMQADFETDLAEIRRQVAAAKPEQVQKLMARDPVLPRMAVLMRDNQCETLGELDAVLRRYGSSLDKQIRLYGENKAGRSTIQKYVNIKPEVTHQEMLDYYRENAAEFAVPAKARFEILTVKFANFRTKQEAWDMLGQMGNAVFFNTPFATVARNHSQEPNAEKGGYYDWTTQGSLASKPIDAAVFSLEPGKLSERIEDERGFHIIRVIERTPAGQVSFLEAQPGIKKALIAQKLDADYKEYVEMLRTSTRVWTIYDETAIADRPTTAGQPMTSERR
jgi:hypothetical protein